MRLRQLCLVLHQHRDRFGDSTANNNKRFKAFRPRLSSRPGLPHKHDHCLAHLAVVCNPGGLQTTQNLKPQIPHLHASCIGLCGNDRRCNFPCTAFGELARSRVVGRSAEKRLGHGTYNPEPQTPAGSATCLAVKHPKP